MKTIIVLIVSMVLSGLVFAHDSDKRAFKNDNNNSWQQMDRWRGTMHGFSVSSDEVTAGVSLKISTDSKQISENLKTDFQVNEKDLTAYFEGVNIVLTETEKGFELNLSSDKAETVKKLQYTKEDLLYQYLRDKMHNGFDDRMGFRGHMGGFDKAGQGYGPGMMRGNYGARGYGPGMMRGNYDAKNYGPGMMDLGATP